MSDEEPPVPEEVHPEAFDTAFQRSFEDLRLGDASHFRDFPGPGTHE
jgi:hypothetical protein